MTDSVLTLLVIFFLFVLCSIAAAGYFYLLRRKPAEAPKAPARDWAIDEERAPESPVEHLADALRRLGQKTSGKKTKAQACQKALSAAGYRSTTAWQVFSGIRIASSAAIGISLCWVALLIFQNVESALVGVIAGGVFGHVLPDWILEGIIKSRNSRFRAALPAALDIIALSIEAGQPMDQAIDASSRELRKVYPDLSMEFSGVMRELRAGKSRIEALNDIAERNREPELKKVCKLLMDGDRFGISLVPALRSHSRFMRVRGRQKAQEAARKVSVKLVFPVFFLIFPSVLLITLGPAVIQIMATLKVMF